MTRARLVDAATELFASHGFQRTATEDIVQRAGLTRGALYHHFVDKEDLFRAVLVEVTADAIATVRTLASKARYTDLWAQAIDGTLAYLDACLDPGRTRILLVDGPQLFGLLTVVEIADKSRESDWQETLSNAMRQGLIERLPLAALAHQLTAAVTEAGIYVARSDDPAKARRDSRRVLRRTMEGLRRRS